MKENTNSGTTNKNNDTQTHAKYAIYINAYNFFDVKGNNKRNDK